MSGQAAMGAILGLGGLALLPVPAATGGPLLASRAAITVGAYMAIVPMFAGYLLFGWGLAHVTASTAGIGLVLACLVVLTAPVRVSRWVPSVARSRPVPDCAA